MVDAGSTSIGFGKVVSGCRRVEGTSRRVDDDAEVDGAVRSGIVVVRKGWLTVVLGAVWIGSVAVVVGGSWLVDVVDSGMGCVDSTTVGFGALVVVDDGRGASVVVSGFGQSAR